MSNSVPKQENIGNCVGSAVQKKNVSAAEDACLVDRTLVGDKQAFNSLFARYRKRVFAICLDFAYGDKELADDLCQEIFLCAFRDLHQLREKTRFRHWLEVIARNKCITHIHKQQTVSQAMKDYEIVKFALMENEREWSAVELELVEKLIEEIPNTKLRETVRLFYIDGKNSAQIADIQGIPQTTITTRLNRFRINYRRRIIREIAKLRALRP